MCARIDQSELALAELKRRGLHPKASARREVFPMQKVGFLRSTAAGLAAAAGQWGLVPSWAADADYGKGKFCARSDGLATTRTWQEAFKSRRAVVPVDGFYEWTPKSKGKQVMMGFCDVEERPLWLAGLWEWHPKLQLASVAIITVDPNARAAQVHDRMPAMLTAEQAQAWVDLGDTALLTACPSERLAYLAAGPMVTWATTRETQRNRDLADAHARRVGRDAMEGTAVDSPEALRARLRGPEGKT